MPKLFASGRPRVSRMRPTIIFPLSPTPDMSPMGSCRLVPPVPFYGTSRPTTASPTPGVYATPRSIPP